VCVHFFVVAVAFGLLFREIRRFEAKLQALEGAGQKA
jgi:hypothetical protein